MARNIIEYLPDQADVVDYSSYDSTKTAIGPMIYQYTGATAEDNYFSTAPLGYIDPTQDTGLLGWQDIAVVKISDTKQWVFLQRGYNVTSNSVRIVAYEFDIETSQYTYKGIINASTWNSTLNTWYGLQALLTRYTQGTVEVNGTSVIGSGSDWINDGISNGCRIGFGSTDPSAITTWYKISTFPETSRTGFNGTVRSTTVDSSGNIYCVGEFTSYTDSDGVAVTANRIIKLFPDGSIDTSFNTGTGFNGIALTVAIDPLTGKIYVGGSTFTTYNGVSSPRIVRLNTDGSIDTAFVVGTGFNNTVREMVFDSSSNIYVVGEFTTWDGVTNNRIIKLDSTGTKDATFDNTTGFNNAVYTICWGETDRLYVGGLFTTWKGVTNNRIIKLDTTGTKDATFDNTTGANNSVYALVYDSVNNEIVVGGAFTTWKGSANSYLTKLTNTGTSIYASRANSAVYSMVAYGTSIYAVGIFGNLGGGVANLFGKINLSDLLLDPDFDNNAVYATIGSTVNGNAVAVNSAGTKVYIPTANLTTNRGMVVLSTSDGALDSTWYRLSSQKITLTSSAGTIPAGTPYVIEDLRFFTNRITTVTGLYMVRGVSWDDFIPATTTYASPEDQISLAPGAYYMVDADNAGNSVIGFAAGTMIDDYVDDQNQWIYVMTTAGRIAGFNFRKQLKQYANSRIRYGGYTNYTDYLITNSPGLSLNTYHRSALCTLNHGTANGVKSIYCTANSVVYQIPFSSVTNGGTPTFTQMAEIPPGSTTTYEATNTMYRLYYIEKLDRLIIMTTPSSGQKSYITSYRDNLVTPTISGTFYDRDTYNSLATQNSFERAFLINGEQLQNSGKAVGVPMYPDTQGAANPFSIAIEDGIMHMVRMVSTIENILYAVPLGADSDYVSYTNNALITPKYIIPNLISITGMYFNSVREYGSSIYSVPPEPLLVDFRTTGIDDNSGTWTEFTNIDSLNGILCNSATPNVTIQFRFRFRVAGNICYPNRLYGFAFTYEDDRTDSHYAPSVAESSLANRIFAWQQEILWGGTIPNLKIRIYNASNGDLLLYDTVSESSSGTWQYSTDGVTWNTWSSSADAVGNYIRYTADYIPNGFKLRVGLNTV